MIEAISFISPAHIALVPVIIGLTSILKSMKWFDSSYSPLVALVLGLGASILIGGSLVSIIVGGVTLGLMACGLYSGTSAVRELGQE